ncbi:50S ribosomal protein L5 [Candidatus Desantisbacteria bacterium]|nr:50S ribosomal protein L5 [Candidatus Desantisbacteria bacterium]
MPRMKNKYIDEVIPKMMKRFGYKNKMQAPRMEKIVINMGVGEAVQDPKNMDSAVEELAAISGQRPVLRKSKKSIAAFKIRQGIPVGCMVTLRGNKMYEFFDRLVNVSLPRIRDFRGISGRSFDGRGNFALGIKEQLIFPEIDYDKISEIRGMDIVIVTTAKNDEEAREFLAYMGIPFRKD